MKCYIFSMCLNEIAIIWHQFSFNLLKVNFWKIILLKHEKTYFKNTYSLTIIILIFNKYYVLWSPFENWNKLRVLSHLNNAMLMWHFEVLQQHFEHTRQCTYWIWGLQSIAAAYKTVCHFVKYRYMSLFWILLQWRIQKGAHPARIPSKVVKKNKAKLYSFWQF